MRLQIAIAFVLLTHMSVCAQFVDDFSDGNITSNPAWTGDIADFVVTPEKVLQLNAAIEGTSAIHTGIVLGDSAEWKFYYQMAFAPSSSNRLRVYLILDTDTLSSANGYFVEIGENGSADALRLFRLDAGIATELAGSQGVFGSDPSEARVKLTRNIAGQWSAFADLEGGEAYTPLFSTIESTYALTSATVFCLECTYSDSRKDKFFFDDFSVGLPTQDTASPYLVGVTASDELHLVAQFNEELDPVNALNPLLYTVLPGIGSPVTVDFIDVEHREVELILTSSLQPAIDHILEVDGVHDLFGNPAETSFGFQYIRLAQPIPYDILINEIMADPSPPLGLPNAEYLELYNRSDETFQLENYALTVGSQTVFVPAWLLETQAYVILVDQGDSSLFIGIPNVLAIDLPTLTNSGTTIELSDDMGTVLHRISYDLTSYQDPARDDGGWSLELINPLAPCLLASNLRASLDLTGGTPGRQNSVTINSEVDTMGPVLQRVFPESATGIQCVFDEVISEDGLLISLQPQHTFASWAAEDNILEITLQTPMQTGIPYVLTVEQIPDCVGNVRRNQSLTFALPQEAEVGDLFINELLFDPQTGGSRFLEVINVSNKFIDLNDIIIADIQGDTISVYPIETSFLCFPGAITAVTPNPQDVETRYFMHDPAQIIFSALPAFNRTSGNATIYTRTGVVLDAFDYNADFHNALLDDTRGISLERISTQLNTQNHETWYSAAETAGFATPGLPNSQRLPDFSGAGIVDIAPKIFSPDGDGNDDFLLISFPGASPGMLASVRIFDPQGRQVARPAVNVSIGQNAVIRWDGTDESGSRARIGPYVVWIELYGADGNVDHYKKTCVLAERL